MADHADAITPSDVETITGTPEQVRARLATTVGGSVVALMLSPGTSQATLGALATTMGSMAPLVPAILARRRKEVFETIVDALVPSIPLSDTMLEEARMVAEARQAVLTGADWVTAAQVATLAGFSTSNPSAQPSKWKRDGAIFAVRHKGIDYYPGYALDPDNGYRPYKGLAQVLSVFGDRKDAWRLAYWFGSVNGALGGERPCDVLASAPDRVAAAAEREIEGPVHG